MVSNSAQQPGPQPPKEWLYLLSALATTAVIVLTGSLAGSVYVTLQTRSSIERQRQEQMRNQVHWYQLDSAEAAFIQQDYLTCLAELSKIPKDSLYVYRIQQLLNNCYTPLGQEWLLQAETLANQGQLKAAIRVAVQIEAGPFQAAAQQRIRTWSQRIIELATEAYASPTAELSAALTMLRAIPEEAPLYQTSQNLIHQWQQEWFDNQHYAQVARLALETKDLRTAIQAAESMSHHPAWASERSQILLSAQAVEQSFNQLSDRAAQYLRAGELQLAADMALQLPDVAPWKHQKLEILAQVSRREDRADRLIVLIAALTVLFLMSVFTSLYARR